MTLTSAAPTHSLTVPPPQRRRRTALRGRWVLVTFIGPLVVYLVAFFAYPLVRGVQMSLQNFNVAALVHGSGAWVGLKNYQAVLASDVTRGAILRTALFTVASVVFAISIGLAVAVYFNRTFPLHRFLRALILLPWLLPAMAAGTIFRIMFADDGLANRIIQSLGLSDHPIPWLSHAGTAFVALILVNIWAGVSFPAVTFYAGLQDIPRTLYEAAEIDGAGLWTRFRRITMPMLQPVTLIVLVYGIIYTVKVFDIVWVMTSGGPADGTQLLSTWAYTESFTNYSFGRGAAVSNLLLLFSMLIGVLYVAISRRSER